MAVLSLYVFIVLSLIAGVCSQVQPVVWFHPDTEYTYKYEGYTHIKDVALIKVSAKVGIVNTYADPCSIMYDQCIKVSCVLAIMQLKKTAKILMVEYITRRVVYRVGESGEFIYIVYIYIYHIN